MSLRMSSGTWILLLGLALAVGLGPLFLRGNAAELARLEANEKKIAGMTVAERARLDRNYATYKGMSETERAQWREFYLKLQQDQQSNNGRLTKTMDDYYDWLQSISGSRRDELMKQTQIPQRIQTIERIVDAELEETLARTMGGVQRQGRGRMIPLLDREQLLVLLEWVAIRLRLNESDLVNEQQESLVGLDRAIRILQLAGERNRSLYSLWFDRASQSDALSSLGTELQQFFLDGKPALATDFQMVESVKLTMLREFEIEAARSTPAEPDLRAVLENLNEAEKDILWNESAQAIVASLRDRYLRDKKSGSIEFDREKVLLAFRPNPEIRQQIQAVEQRLQERDGRRPGFLRIPPEGGQRPPGNPDHRPPGDAPPNNGPRSDRPPGDRAAGERPPERRPGDGPPPERRPDPERPRRD